MDTTAYRAAGLCLAAFLFVAGCGVDAEGPDATAPGPLLLGVEAMRDAPPWTLDPDEGLTLLLSKSVYPFEDGHLDAIAWLGDGTGPRPPGALTVRLTDEAGQEQGHGRIEPIPGAGVFFSVAIPEELAGRRGRLEVAWDRAEAEREQASASFEVAAPAPAPRAGRIALRIANTTGAELAGAPMTVGVPFPRGALEDEARVRLVDERGAEVPLQTRVTSRWSRFGSIRWLLCDFTTDLDGAPRELHLEYGPGVRRAPGDTDWVESEARGGFPRIETGPLRLDAQGVHLAIAGERVRVLEGAALRGAFVEHEDGTCYRQAEAAGYAIEELGPAKVVLRREGWYRASGGERFCRYVTRLVAHRGSRLVRIFHTWIFTGNAEEDRIANMGWRLSHGPGLEAEGFLDEFGAQGSWRPGRYLVQRDFEEYELGDETGAETVNGHPAGVFAASGRGARLWAGVRDFHPNYPRELAFEDGALVFYEWPRRGRAPRHTAHHEAPHRLWFAHEGEVMDLSLPAAYSQEPIILEIASSRRQSDSYTYAGKGRRLVNAQGVAKTAELWLLFGSSEEPAEAGARVLQGVHEETLRAVVDPAWVAASGAFHEIHPRDTERFAEEERVYELHALAPIRWAKRAHVYGKWLWGVTPHAPQLRERYQAQHRAFRKSHQGWPYSWLPYARSGDPRFLRYADAATRFQADIAFCHYSDERVPAPGEDRPRARGWYTRDRIPWAHNRRMATSRAREDKVHYLWDSYYLTGYHRARDVALDFGELTKHEGAGTNGRWACREALDYDTDLRNVRVVATLLRTYVEMYQATFDPWFLAAAHRIARRVVEAHDPRVEGSPPVPRSLYSYNTGLRDFHRFTADAGIEAVLDRTAREALVQREAGAAGVWLTVGGTMVGSLANAWRLAGEEEQRTFYVRRLAGWLDRARTATYDGTPEYAQGVLVRAQGHAHPPMFTGWYLEQFPSALDVLARAGGSPASLPSAFYQLPAQAEDLGDGVLFRYRMPSIALHKRDGEPLPIALRVQASREDRRAEQLFRFVIEGPGDMRINGEWDVRGEENIEIPASAPPGVYRLRVEGESPVSPQGWHGAMPWIYLPVSPADVAEVIELDEGEAMGPASAYAVYAFRVPADISSFDVIFNVPAFSRDKDCPLVRFCIWDADGKPAWIRQFDRFEYPDVDRVQASVPVPVEQRDRIWRITLPHQRVQRGPPAFEMDPRIPPFYAVSADRWFDPLSVREARDGTDP